MEIPIINPTQPTANFSYFSSSFEKLEEITQEPDSLPEHLAEMREDTHKNRALSKPVKPASFNVTDTSQFSPNYLSVKHHPQNSSPCEKLGPSTETPGINVLQSVCDSTEIDELEELSRSNPKYTELTPVKISEQNDGCGHVFTPPTLDFRLKYRCKWLVVRWLEIRRPEIRWPSHHFKAHLGLFGGFSWRPEVLAS